MERKKQSNEQKKYGPIPKDPYEALGLYKNASNRQIRQAYLKKSREYHPDTNKDEEAKEWQKAINEAYDVLANKKNPDHYFRDWHRTGRPNKTKTNKTNSEKQQTGKERQEAEEKIRKEKERKAAEDAKKAQEQAEREENEKRSQEEQKKAKQKEEEKLNEEEASVKQETENLSPEEKALNDARTKYAEGYKKFMAGAGWLTRSYRFVAGAKIDDSKIPPELKKLEKEYEEAQIDYGNLMFREKRTELKNSSLSDTEKEIELKRYKQVEIFTKVIAEEDSKLKALKTENQTPKEKAAWEKVLGWYMNQPRWKKLAISTVLGTAIFASIPGGVLAAGGGLTSLAGMAGMRGTRAVAGSIVGQSFVKGFDWLFKEKSAEKRTEDEEKLKEIFKEEVFDVSLAKNKKEYAEILERERKAKRNRLITKALLGLAAGAGTSYGMGHLLNNVPDQLHTSGIKSEVIPNSTSLPKTEILNNVPKTPSIINNFVNDGIKFEHGKGGIQGILDLKQQITEQYHGDFSTAPKSVQEFMNTDATKEAIKLGLFAPNAESGEESAKILAGSVLKFDEHGNLLFGTPDSSGNIPSIEKHHWEMFDSDKSAKIPIAEDIKPESIKVPLNTETPSPEQLEPRLEATTEPEAQTVTEPTHNEIVQEKIEEIKAQITETEKTNIADHVTKRPKFAYQTRRVGEIHPVGEMRGIGSEVTIGNKVNINETINTEEGINIGRNSGIRFSEHLDKVSYRDTYLFGKNPFNLSQEQIAISINANYENLKHIFGKYQNPLAEWENLSTQKAGKILEYTGLDSTDPKSTLSGYLKMLKNFTHLEPEKGFLGMGGESSDEYIARALQKLESTRQLDKFEDTLINYN